MAKVRTPCAYSSTELKNLIERFIQQSISRIGLMSVSMTIFFPYRKKNCGRGSMCLELAEIIPTVLAYGNGQSVVHDILGKGWWLS